MSAAETAAASPTSPRTIRRRPWLAALLSLLAPGAGQLYNGDGRLGWSLFAVFAGLQVILDVMLLHLAMRSIAIGFVLLSLAEVALRIGAAVQAFRSARRVRASGMARYQHAWVYALLVLLVPVANAVAEPAPQAKSFFAPSAAMVPTLLVGDYFIVDTQYYRRHEPQRGDVAVFKLPRDPSTDYVKRIVGLPGDHIQMRQGDLYINDQPAPRRPIEDYGYDGGGGVRVVLHQYIEALARGPGEPPREHRIAKVGDKGPLDNTPIYEVPAGHYFTMGDNRDNSQDSRMLSAVGYIPAANLVGRAEFLSFSTDGSARWWQLWRWPTAIRYGRLFHGVQ